MCGVGVYLESVEGSLLVQADVTGAWWGPLWAMVGNRGCGLGGSVVRATVRRRGRK